jgi:hypothetical protein
MDKLYAHLHRSMAQPFVWGESDCMLDVANYLLLLTGRDCGKRYRGLYDSAFTCQKASGFLNDPVKPMAECAEEFPLAMTTEPKRGDVGVVLVQDGRKVKATGGICLGRSWAVKAETGLAIGPAIEVLAAWSAPDA